MEIENFVSLLGCRHVSKHDVHLYKTNISKIANTMHPIITVTFIPYALTGTIINKVFIKTTNRFFLYSNPLRN